MEWLLQFVPQRQSMLVRWVVSALMVLLAFACRFALQAHGGSYAFMLFVPLIIASAFLFDRGSGVVALILSTALSAALLDWNVNADIHTSALATFFIVGLPLVLIGEGLHRALERALRAEEAQSALLMEKDLLLREMKHRVKNEFAMILSLIGLQSRQLQPELRPWTPSLSECDSFQASTTACRAHLRTTIAWTWLSTSVTYVGHFKIAFASFACGGQRASRTHNGRAGASAVSRFDRQRAGNKYAKARFRRGPC